MLEAFGAGLWFGAQGVVVGIAGTFFATRTGVLLTRKWAALAFALVVACTLMSCAYALSIVMELEWLRPSPVATFLAAWFGTAAVVAPQPAPTLLHGPVGPANRAFWAAGRTVVPPMRTVEKAPIEGPIGPASRAFGTARRRSES